MLAMDKNDAELRKKRAKTRRSRENRQNSMSCIDTGLL